MKKEELYRFVDHTALKAVTTWNEIQQLCQEARFFRMASVCIPSSYVKRAHEYFPELNICTVVGFPLGNASTEAKLAETRQALEDGANEIDMVINLGMVKNQEYPQVTEEIRLLKEATGDKILKVIIETCLLTEEEKVKEGEEGEPKKKAKIVKRPVSLSDTHPLWSKSPSECTKEEYIDFYRKVFMDYKEPLFWIHLNMDYPFNLKGILYFPKINTEYESIEGTIKLYNNQVFIADNIKEVIPEFLMVLKGVIDCPDLPLNVSRSALQNDGFVNKVADYISKKVADKLTGMFKTDRENYEKYWDDISPFIKFGCLKDEKFGEKMKDSMIYKNLDHKYLTLEDIINESKAAGTEEETAEEAAAETDVQTDTDDQDKEPEKTSVYYVTDEVQQSQYINMFKAQGQDAIVLTHNIDSAFVTYLEQKHEDVRFLRIDADVHESLKDEVAEDEKESFGKMADSLVEIFRKELNDDKLDVKVEKLKDDKVASMAVLSEENRRMEEMMKMYGMSGMDSAMFGSKATLVLNANHPLVKFLTENKESENVTVICKQLYDLAMLAHKPLSPEEMTAFVQRSNEIMLLLTK